MRRRVLTSILLVIGAMVLTLGVPLAIVSWRLVDDIVHQELASRLNAIAASITTQTEETGDVDLHRLEVAVPANGRLVIRLPGAIDQTVGDPISGAVISEQLITAGGALLRLSVPVENVRNEQFGALLLVGLAVLLSIVVGAAIAIYTARRLSTPLSDVARRAARLGAGDFRASRRRYGVAELDRVSDVLDSSAGDIAALIARERDLASDISHQLRTRLTGLRLRLEELSAHPDPAVVSEVQAALDQTDRLVQVVDDLLANARSQRAAGATELILADELREVSGEWQPAFATAKRQLTVRCPPSIVVHATAVRLREALGVLVENALKHGGGTVRIAVRPGPATVVLEISDEGPGIADALVGHVFDRGVSTADSTGIGLGLARAFIEADGGRLELLRARPPMFGVFLAVGRPVPVDDGDDADRVEAGDTDDEAPANRSRPGALPDGAAPAPAAGSVARQGAGSRPRDDAEF